MEIWTSFEAKFKPFPHSKTAGEMDDFFMKLAENAYDPERFDIDCSLSLVSGVYYFTTHGDVNPKEFVPKVAGLIASLGGEGNITTEYVTTIMEVP